MSPTLSTPLLYARAAASNTSVSYLFRNVSLVALAQKTGFKCRAARAIAFFVSWVAIAAFSHAKT